MAINKCRNCGARKTENGFKVILTIKENRPTIKFFYCDRNCYRQSEVAKNV